MKQAVDQCIACQANRPATRPDPLQMSPLPPEPWHTVHVDFCGPFPTGEYLLVGIDAYSRFPEVDIIHSTAAKGTISNLERIFATHGIPQVIKSDNGPPFFGEEIKAYIEENRKWNCAQENHAIMATSKCRSRKLHETHHQGNPCSSCRRTRLEEGPLSLFVELSSNPPLYDRICSSTRTYCLIATSGQNFLKLSVIAASLNWDRKFR